MKKELIIDGTTILIKDVISKLETKLGSKKSEEQFKVKYCQNINGTRYTFEMEKNPKYFGCGQTFLNVYSNNQEVYEEILDEEFLNFINEKEYKALIDTGKTSGKHPFVHYVTDKNWSKETQYLIDNDKFGYKSINITEKEYEHIQQISELIEVLYNEFGTEVNKKFFY